MNSLNTSPIKELLLRLHKEAFNQIPFEFHQNKFNNPDRLDFFRSTAQLLYLAVDPEVGAFLYMITRAVKPALIVEFGTSFGVSTIYLAAGAKDNKIGKVIGSEFVEEKGIQALKHLEEAGLKEYVQIEIGDARKGLAKIDQPIDLLFLDGAKNLYLEIFKLLEPKFSPNISIIADNVDHEGLEDYLEYVRNPKNDYTSITFDKHGQIEYTVKTI